MVIVERPGFTPEGIEWDAANGRFLYYERDEDAVAAARTALADILR